MNKKLLCVVLGIMMVIVLIPNAQAASWNPWPCENECNLGESRCTEQGNMMEECGDYDTWVDWDSCYEWPPGDGRGETNCPHGCTGGDGTPVVCQRTDPCAGWDVCIPGSRPKCGGVNNDEIVTCNKNSFGCYTWKSSGYTCPNGCSGGTCLTSEGYDCSNCNPGESKCVGDVVFYCRRVEEGSECFDWKSDPFSAKSCIYGCIEEGSTAYCLERTGETDCNDCEIDETRCHPDDDNFMQVCHVRNIDENGCNRWPPDNKIPIFEGMYDDVSWCPLGCTYGFCRAPIDLPTDPDRFVCDAECNIGETACRPGGIISTCLYDAEVGCNVWGEERECKSGVCVSGGCAKETEQGYNFNLLPVSSNYTYWYDTDNIAVDDLGQIYLEAMTIELSDDAANNNHIYIFNPDGGYTSKCNISTIICKSLYHDGDSLFCRNLTSVMSINIEDCSITHIFPAENIPAGSNYPDEAFTGNRTNFFLLGTDGINMTDPSGNEIYDFCLIDDNAKCLPDTTHPNEYQMTYFKGKIYQLDNIYTNDSLFISDNAVMQTYKPDGEYLGYIDISRDSTAIPIYITSDSRHIYLKWDQSIDSGATKLGETTMIEVWKEETFCDNECHNGSSECQGTLLDMGIKPYAVDCVQDDNGCWKWGTKPDDRKLCIFGCKERWINHRLKEAYCGEDRICPNEGCIPNTRKCDFTNTYSQTCVLNTENRCYEWGNIINCGLGRCSSGNCRLLDDICIEGTSKCENNIILNPFGPIYGEKLRTQNYVRPCAWEDGKWQWSNNRDLWTPCYNSICNQSFNPVTNITIGECVLQNQGDYALQESYEEWVISFQIMAGCNKDVLGNWNCDIFSGVTWSAIFIIIIIVACFALTKEWKLTMIAGLIGLLLSLAMGWLPLIVGIVLVVFVGILWFLKLRGGG